LRTSALRRGESADLRGIFISCRLAHRRIQRRVMTYGFLLLSQACASNRRVNRQGC
jgi:hypothetical protein